jgi:hypothetical protein
MSTLVSDADAGVPDGFTSVSFRGAYCDIGTSRCVRSVAPTSQIPKTGEGG